jgi:hypothetical protein
MFEKFLNGFITFLPFYYRSNNEVKFYPDDIYVNDWKMIGRVIIQGIKKSKNFVNINEENEEEI